MEDKIDNILLKMFHGGAYDIAKEQIKVDQFGMVPYGYNLITVPARCNGERYEITVNVTVFRIEMVKAESWCLHCYNRPLEETTDYGDYYFVTGDYEQFETEWAMLVLVYF